MIFGKQSSGRGEASAGTPEPARVHMLGGFSVSVGSRPVGEGSWRLKKAASLVKLLALTEKHRLHREWSAANNLRYALRVARKTLEPGPGTTSRYLQLQGEQVALCPEGPRYVDVWAFEEAVATARRTLDHVAYRDVADLYAGDLLPGDLYERWRRSGGGGSCGACTSPCFWSWPGSMRSEES